MLAEVRIRFGHQRIETALRQMAKVTPDTFEKQLTQTLRMKGVKKMSDLVTHYKSISEAVNETSAKGYGEIGQKNYQHAKNLTLRFKKREKEYDELKKLWNEYEEHVGTAAGAQATSPNGSGTTQSDADTHDHPINMEVSMSTLALDKEELPTEIVSDKDLAVVLMAMIQEQFYNPDSGLWPKYDKSFKKEDYTKHGQPGWETDRVDGPAREMINRKKNEEIHKLMTSKFVHDAIDHIYDIVHVLVYGLKKKDVKHGVKNHIRYHMFNLIYGDLKKA